IGSWASKSANGTFSFDGTRFTNIEGTDADKPGAKTPMEAVLYVGNPLGVIIAVDRMNVARVAILPGQATPKFAETFDAARMWGFAQRARARQVPGVNKPDPNFGLNAGQFQQRGFLLQWSYTRSNGVPDIEGAEYVGFDDQASWFTRNGILY